MYERCNPQQVAGCAYIVGVVGTSAELSSYRLKGFYGTNKLKIGVPVVNSTESSEYNGSFYDYFWFSINDTVYYHDNYFDYSVSVGTKDGENPDLFVSLMDGRYPTDDDFDL